MAGGPAGAEGGEGTCAGCCGGGTPWSGNNGIRSGRLNPPYTALCCCCDGVAGGGCAAPTRPCIDDDGGGGGGAIPPPLPAPVPGRLAPGVNAPAARTLGFGATGKSSKNPLPPAGVPVFAPAPLGGREPTPPVPPEAALVDVAGGGGCAAEGGGAPGTPGASVTTGVPRVAGGTAPKELVRGGGPGCCGGWEVGVGLEVEVGPAACGRRRGLTTSMGRS